MRLSQALAPSLREVPAEAHLPSHQLMLRAGLIRQVTSGQYAWLPLGLRVLDKISDFIRKEQDKIGGQEILMPILQPADLWKRSGRYDAYGPEMLRAKDRHDRELVYGPTCEEMVTDIFGGVVKSYKQLPQYLYQIQWKFRDEIRPRFGVMRGREFLMKDGYSFDVDAKAAEETYFRVMLSYLRLFKKLGLTAIPMAADTGEIGGSLSHEFLVPALNGESKVFYDARWEKVDWDSHETEDPLLERLRTVESEWYAASEEMHDEKSSGWQNLPKEWRCEGRGIEVGHLFLLGDKYTASMDVRVAGANGEQIAPIMGCYGIGVSRLVAAIIEASCDARGIIWPESVAPYKGSLLNLAPGNPGCDKLANKIYQPNQDDILFDDRDERAGVKFNDADLLGLPWQIVVGPKYASDEKVELKNRKTGKSEVLPWEEALRKIGVVISADVRAL